MAPAEEAREHMAQKALTASWMSLKFSPDFLSASLEFTQAATLFRAAGLLQDAIEAWVRAAEMKDKLHDQFGAGRAYESAAAICDGGGPGGAPAAAEYWEKAIRCFRLCGKSEIAAKLILKMATLRDKEGDVAGTKQAYEDAIEVFTDAEQDYNLGDVYKQYVGFLVRSGLFDAAVKAIDGHIEVLLRQKHHAFAHKELLAKAVLMLHAEDNVRAEEALNPSFSVEGWFMSKESQVGSDLLGAFKENDAEALQRVQKEQVLTFLQVEIARIAKQLRVPTFAAPAPAAAAAGGGGAAPAEAPQEQDRSEMLM